MLGPHKLKFGLGLLGRGLRLPDLLPLDLRDDGQGLEAGVDVRDVRLIDKRVGRLYNVAVRNAEIAEKIARRVVEQRKILGPLFFLFFVTSPQVLGVNRDHQLVSFLFLLLSLFLHILFMIHYLFFLFLFFLFFLFFSQYHIFDEQN